MNLQDLSTGSAIPNLHRTIRRGLVVASMLVAVMTLACCARATPAAAAGPPTRVVRHFATIKTTGPHYIFDSDQFASNP